jgi:hypothetical protein
MIDHGEIREQLELAAVQPGGLDRLAAGDTPQAAALAGHLAGCPSCSSEADRLRASAGFIREAVLETPPPELRDRTIQLIRSTGRARPVAASAPISIATVTIVQRRSLRTIALALGIAAAIVISIAGTAALVANQTDPALASSQETSTELARVASWTLQVDAEPDVKRITLVSHTGSPAHGTLLFSPTSTDLVVVASGLAPAPAGDEYRCWVLINGTRLDVGRMDIGSGLAYWVGPVAGLVSPPAGTPFGVSLAAINGPIAPGDPVIGGSFGG